MTIFYVSPKPSKDAKPSKRHKYSLIKSALLMALLPLISINASVAAPALMQGEHSSNDVDVSAPIKALANLSSLAGDTTTPAVAMTLPNFQHFTTKNGVPVIFFSTNQLPIVDVDMRFKAGSAYDGSIRPGVDGKVNGLASIVATMLLKGTDTLSEDEYAEVSEQLGLSLGTDVTNDQLIVSLRSLSDENNLKPALKLMQAAIVKPRFDKAVLERTKAQQLTGLNYMQQNPDYISSTVFTHELYGDHPYAQGTYGNLASVPNITQDDLQRFHDRYLVAKNATINITGDLSLAAAKEVAETLSAHLAMGKPAAPLPAPVAPKTGKHIHIDYDSSQTAILMGQLGVAVNPDPVVTQQHSAFNIGNDVLAGGGFHSRLTDKVRKALGYTYSIGGGMSPMQVAGPYTINFSTRTDKADAAIAATLDTIDTTLAQGITKDELELTKENFINSYPMRFASNASINATIGVLNVYGLPDSRVTDYIKRVEQADLDSVNKVLKQTLNSEDFIIVSVGGLSDSKPDSNSTSDSTPKSSDSIQPQLANTASSKASSSDASISNSLVNKGVKIDERYRTLQDYLQGNTYTIANTAANTTPVNQTTNE